MTITAVFEPLNATHRCDSCGAQAKASATSPDALSSLLFCGHHTNKHAPGLESKGWRVHRPNGEVTRV